MVEKHSDTGFPLAEGRGEAIHVVCFNVPWPADYGGVIDVYYRVKRLVELGWKVYLHCFTYGRAEAQELQDLCEEVHYYRRATGWRNQLKRRPYIVASRHSEELLARLRQDSAPILLEGLHDCDVLEQLYDGRRIIYVRAHNVEHDYYHALAKDEKKGWKRLFFMTEAAKLRRYEQVLLKATEVWAISTNDAAHFERIGCRRVRVVAPSHGNPQVTSLPGRGEYVLYHGNLLVGENVRAVRFLADHLFCEREYAFVVAGRDPDEEVVRLVQKHSNVRLVPNPSDDEMRSLIANAQVNVLVTDQPTGVKLKLMNALYQGRHCLANGLMVAGTPLAEACVVADTPEAMRQQLARLWNTEFTQEDIEKRKAILARG